MAVSANCCEQARVLDGPTYVLCEGESDRAFLEMLISEYELVGIEVGSPQDSNRFGKDAFPVHLLGLATSESYQRIENLLVIADNDDDPAAAQSACQAALREIGYEVPNPPAVLESDKKVAIHMLPSLGVTGGLEQLILSALFEVNPGLRACIDDYSKCTGRVGSWTANPRAKMEMVCIIASHCQDNPGVPLR